MLLGLAGCSSPGPSAQAYNLRQFPAVPRDTLFARAEQALLELGYQPDKVDEAKGLLTSVPVIGDGRGEPTRGGIALGSTTVRTMAEIRIVPSGGGCSVYCRVVIQQLTTAAHAMFMQDRGASDVPSDTPIDREGATTAEQNEVWTTIRRDRAKERAILEAIGDA